MYLVQQAKAEVVDRLRLPLRQRRVEGDGLGLQHAEGHRHEDSVRSKDARAAGLGGAGMHFDPCGGGKVQRSV